MKPSEEEATVRIEKAKATPHDEAKEESEISFLVGERQDDCFHNCQA